MLKYPPDLDRVFHALADPSRRAMLERLQRGSASVSELAQPLAMSLAAVVQHLQVLEDSGLVRSHKTGRVRICRLDRTALGEAEHWIGQRRAPPEPPSDDRLAPVADGLPPPRGPALAR